VHHIWPNAIKHFQLHNNIRIDSTEDAVKIISELSNHKASVIADVEKIPRCPTLKKSNPTIHFVSATILYLELIHQCKQLN